MLKKVSNRDDIGSIVAIDTMAFDSPITFNTCKSVLSKNNVFAYISYARQSDMPVSYAIWRRDRDKIVILRMATIPDARRLGFMEEIFDSLKSKVNDSMTVDYISCIVEEENLTTQLFLSKMGFTCVEIVKDGDRSFYKFLWSTDREY